MKPNSFHANRRWSAERAIVISISTREMACGRQSRRRYVIAITQDKQSASITPSDLAILPTQLSHPVE